MILEVWLQRIRGLFRALTADADDHIYEELIAEAAIGEEEIEAMDEELNLEE